MADWLEAGNLPDDVELTAAVLTGLDQSRPNWPPSDWLDREGYTGRVLVDSGEATVAEAYGMSGTPFWVGIDAQGRVAARAAGQLGMDAVGSLAASLSGS